MKKKVENMSVEELKKYALKYGVTFSKGTKKSDMVKFIKHHEEGLKIAREFKPVMMESSVGAEEELESNSSKGTEEDSSSDSESDSSSDSESEVEEESKYTLLIEIPASSKYSIEDVISNDWWIDNFFHKYYKEDEMPEYIQVENVVFDNEVYSLTITLIYKDKTQEMVESYVNKYKNML